MIFPNQSELVLVGKVSMEMEYWFLSILECVVVAKQTAKPAFLCSVTPIIACERFRWTFAAPFLVNSRSGELFRWNERTKRGVVISSIFVGCYHPIFRSRYIHGPRGGNRKGASPWFVRITWWHECEWLPWSNCKRALNSCRANDKSLFRTVLSLLSISFENPLSLLLP